MANPRPGRTDEALPRLLYTPAEAAEMTTFTRDWLITQAREGKIPHRRYGWRTIRFAPEDLDEIKKIGAQPAAASEVR